MRVVHLTSAHPRDDIRIFQKECKSLIKFGYEVILIVADGLADAIVDGVRILDVGRPKNRWERIFFTTKNVLDKAIELNADVYHLHDPELLLIARALKQNQKKVIFDAHEDLPKQILGKHYLPKIIRGLVSIVVRIYERYVCRQLNGLIAATPNIREKFYLINKNTVDINNYPLLNELESFTAWDEKVDEICYVGGIASIRGIKEMVVAIGFLSPEVRLNLAGIFSETRLESNVKQLSGWKCVNPLGQKDRLEVREILARSKAGLVIFHSLPNHVDAQPNKMFEYMSAGLPVIASNFPLWREIIEGNECGICIDPMNPKEIAAAIEKIIDNPKISKVMGENGRRAVENFYNWSIEEVKLKEFYQALQD